MNALDETLKAFSSAFYSIINTQIFYKSNRTSLIQTGIILLLPQISAYLLQVNAEFGINLHVKLQNYPLLLFLLLVCTMYVIFEPRIKTKNASEVFKLALLSVHLFAFALSLNLIYAVILQIFGLQDFVYQQIQNAFAERRTNLHEPVFAIVYGLPFLIGSVATIYFNSQRLHPWRMQAIIRSFFFWRTFALCLVLAVYQYMAFIEIGAILG